MKSKSSRTDVQRTLDEMNKILCNPDFEIEKDLVFIVNSKDGDDYFYSTAYTMTDLDYDMEDVVETLKTLSVEEYSHTRLDKDDLNPPQLLVFSKFIQSKEVYIKIKVRITKGQVVCVSFHYPKYPLSRPYVK